MDGKVHTSYKFSHTKVGNFMALEKKRTVTFASIE